MKNVTIMPNRDGTGPNGKGARTGGQRGNCPGASPRPGRGGAGRGGRGRGGRGIFIRSEEDGKQ